MAALFDIVNKITGFIWGYPILFLLIGGGIILTGIIGGIQFRRFGFIMKRTLGSLFDKGEQEKKKAAGITPFQSFCVAIGGTIGTGNIVGVGAAIALGGPGALFWMWVCGFIAMAIKYSEVCMSVQYRQKNEDGSYKAGPFIYIRDGLHNHPLAYFFGTLMLITLAIIASVHANAVTSNLETLGLNKNITCVILAVLIILIAVTGLKGLVKVTDKMIPFMTILYLLFALTVIFLHIGKIGEVLSLVFVSAFKGQAAVGGFTGAALAATIRWGLSRGVFSNDAGLGISASLQAQAAGIDHPAQQGMWAIVETFIDTIIVCSLTGFAILFTGVWQEGGNGSTFAAMALKDTLGNVGHIVCVVSLVLFALSSLIAIVEASKVQAVNIFGNKVASSIMVVVVFLLVVGGSIGNLTSIFGFSDLASGLIIFINVPSLIFLGKELRKLTKEWFDNDGDLNRIQANR